MAATQLSQKNPDGTVMGQSATDKIAFCGKTARIPITTFASISVAETTANVKSRVNKILNGLKNLGLIQ
jgi:hypothetical protein